ncbi:hypothetical protein [Wenyingzhuangia sp. IMCC45467]
MKIYILIILTLLFSCNQKKYEKNCNAETYIETKKNENFTTKLEFIKIEGNEHLNAQWIYNTRNNLIGESFGVEILNKKDTISIKDSNIVQFSIHPYFRDSSYVYLLIPKKISQLDCNYTGYSDIDYDTIKNTNEKGLNNEKFSNLTVLLKVYFKSKGKIFTRGIINEVRSKKINGSNEIYQYFIELKHEVTD